MNLNPFAWLRRQIQICLADLEMLRRSIANCKEFFEDLQKTMSKPIEINVTAKGSGDQSLLNRLGQQPVAEPAPATPPNYVPIPVHNYTYFENTKDGFGWITKMAHETEYKCFYCNGHRKELVYRGSQKHAREWMAQFYQ